MSPERFMNPKRVIVLSRQRTVRSGRISVGSFGLPHGS
jgi:hypothetical protein